MVSTTLVAYTGDEPITVATAKDHLKVDFDTDDSIISGLITAARAYAESYLGFAIRAQRKLVYFNCFDGDFVLPGPATEVESIIYVNTEGDDTTISSEDYDTVPGQPMRIYSAEWPDDVATNTPGAVRITYVQGVGSFSDHIRQAMLLTIGSWYENPADQVRRYPTAATLLLDLERERVC